MITFFFFFVIEEDIRIDFGSRHDAQCANSLYNLPDEDALKPWPKALIYTENMFSVRIGPTGGKRGYTPITGQFKISFFLVIILVKKTAISQSEGQISPNPV